MHRSTARFHVCVLAYLLDYKVLRRYSKYMPDRRTSAVETEVLEWYEGFKKFMLSHDRFVLITLALSVSPSPPAPCLCVLLVLFQLRLIRAKKLPQTEVKPLVCALILAVLNISLLASAVWFMAPTYSSFAAYLKTLAHALSHPWFWFTWPFHKVTPDTINV